MTLPLPVGHHSTTGQERQAGYEAALQARGLSPEVHRVAPTREAGIEAAAALLAQADGPDALLASNGLLLMGAVQALQAAGRRSPGQIGLAGFDNNDWTSLPSVDVTVIAQPTYDIGRSAAELMLQRIDDPSRPARKVVLEGQLVIRGSSRGPDGRRG